MFLLDYYHGYIVLYVVFQKLPIKINAFILRFFLCISIGVAVPVIGSDVGLMLNVPQRIPLSVCVKLELKETH